MNLTEKEMRTVIAVFEELVKMPYSELNKFLGSITIEEMQALYLKMYSEYTGENYDD